MSFAPEPPALQPKPAPIPAGWEDILVPSERILWQGRPVPGMRWEGLLSQRTLTGGIFILFALFWTGMAISMGAPGMFLVFGAVFVCIGFYRVIGAVLWEGWLRDHTHYTLTNRTAFIATDLFGKRKLESYPLSAEMPIVLEDGAPGSLFFAERMVTRYVHDSADSFDRRRSGFSLSPRKVRERVGFEQIETPRMVYALMREAIANPPPMGPIP